MAEKKDKKSGLHGPLHTPPAPGKSLGAETPEGPKSGPRVPDPLGFVRRGGGKKDK